MHETTGDWLSSSPTTVEENKGKEKKDSKQLQQQKKEGENEKEKSTEPNGNKGRKKALIIGISKYGNNNDNDNNKFSNLDLCENNANEIYNILKHQGYDIPSKALLVGRVQWAKMRDEIIDFFTDRALKPEDML